MDLLAIENGECHTHLQHLTREALYATSSWERLIFWMDMELALELLTDYERHCFVLSLVEGYTEVEIALRLRVSHKAISLQITKARKKITKFLQEGGYKTP